jgi:cold shock CspA family protein
MLLCWDFKYTDENGKLRETRASQNLIEEVPYPVMMHEVIDNRVNKNDVLIKNLFVSRADHSSSWKSSVHPSYAEEPQTYEEEESNIEFQTSEIISINAGYGFIKSPPNNLFFHFSSLENCDFNDLEVGMKVKYISTTHDGKTQAKKVWIIE